MLLRDASVQRVGHATRKEDVMGVVVLRQLHNNSYHEPQAARRWGVYVDGELVEEGSSLERLQNG